MTVLNKSASRVWVWITRLPAHDGELGAEDFSPAERARAAQLHNPSHQQNFLRRRRFIRQAIASVFDLNASEISVAHESTGQPYLLHARQRLPIYLSISSTDDSAAVAATADCRVGIDMEPILDADPALIARILSAREQTDLLTRPACEAAIALSAYWTRKEAYLKACGTGLTGEPREIEVPLLLPDWPGHWQAMPSEPGYSLASWNQGPHVFSLCLATRRTMPTVQITPDVPGLSFRVF